MVSRQSLDNARRVAEQCLEAIDEAEGIWERLETRSHEGNLKWLREVVIPYSIKLHAIYDEWEKAYSVVREHLELTTENLFILKRLPREGIPLRFFEDTLFPTAHEAAGRLLEDVRDWFDSIEIPSESLGYVHPLEYMNGCYTSLDYDPYIIRVAIVQEWRWAVRGLPKANDIPDKQDEASEALDDTSAKQDEAPGSLDDASDKQSDIPEEFRTLPMSLTDAAMRWFDAQGKAETRSTARLLSRYIKEGKIKYIEVHRQSFIFDKREMAQARKLALLKKQKPC